MRINDDSSLISRIAVIGAPSSAGARQRGQEHAPEAFRQAGLMAQLREEGLDVADFGDLETVSFRPDAKHPKAQNKDLVLNVARRVAERVAQAVSERRLPLVLGGDCSLTLGVIAGLLRHRPGLGLVYFDGDLDLNTPETTASGVFDGMVMAHVLGRGVPLTRLGARTPLLSEDDVVLFGYNLEAGWIDPPELAALERSRVAHYSAARVRKDPEAAARDARRYLDERSDSILVHFDVDVMDTPAADVPHRLGLDAQAAFSALTVFVSDPKCAGIVVTELNSAQDPSGSEARRIVDGLVEALGTRAERAA